MMDWASHAACIDYPTEWWFPGDGRVMQLGNLTKNAIKAIKICRSCPVREECGEYAMTLNENWGIWGGLLPVQRRALKRAREKDPNMELPGC